MDYTEYTRYLDRLDHLIYMELVPKVAILDYFAAHAPKYGTKPEEVEPLLWFITSGMYYDVTLSLFRLFDHGGNSDRDINHFLNVTSNEFKKIAWKKPFPKDKIQQHRTDIENKNALIEKLKYRRNKFFAHCDKDYFYEPDLISKDFPFATEDAIELTRVLQRIISFYHDALHGSRTISLEGFIYAATERLYQMIRESHAQLTTGKPSQSGQGGSA